MAGVKIANDSFLWFAPLIEFSDGSQAFGMLELPILEERSDDTLYRVQSSDTIEGLSLRFYGTVEWWVVIAHANGLTMPTLELWPGRELRIPSLGYVKSVWTPNSRVA